MIYFYDLEVFPNFFSGLFISEDGQDEYVFIKHNDEDTLDIRAMLAFITLQRGLTLVGYNSLGYDDIILKTLIEYPDFTNKQIYQLSKRIIESKKMSELGDTLKQIAYADPPWKPIDLLQLLQVNMNRPSLKHCSIHLEHDWLQDLPLRFDTKIKSDIIDEIIRYNRNDVLITRKIFNIEKVQEALQLRHDLGKEYGVYLLSAGDSKIANVILDSWYGIPEVKETRRETISGIDLIPPTLKFLTPEMQAAQKAVEEMVLVEYEPYKHGLYNQDTRAVEVLGTYGENEYLVEGDDANTKGKFMYDFTFNNVMYTMAKGGLHSQDDPRILRSSDRMILRDADVGSYYPSMVLRYNIAPEHLDKERFMEVYNRLVQERLEGKRTGDKVKADGLKIAINGVFGKLNFPYFWMYDPLAFYRITLYGQLLLLDLVEKLYLAGIDTVSANTDGIVCYFDKSLEDKYYEVCGEWQERTGMNLEYTDYAKLVQLNVNSYMSITLAGKVKTKKDFEDNKSLSKQTFIKGYNAPVIALSLQAYFKDGISPGDFIRNHDNIHDFFYTQRAGQAFKLIYTIDGEEKVLQKTNRYYVSSGGGRLSKQDIRTVNKVGFIKGKTKMNRTISILKGQDVTVLNNLTDKQNPIDYDYYIAKVQELIDKIENRRQVTLFDFV